MLSETEVKVLDILSKNLLARAREISAHIGEEDGVVPTLQKLMSMDCVKTVEPMGEKCYVITQKGTRLLREARNPEKRAQQQGFFTS